MDPVQGVVLGLAMVVGGLLAFRHAPGLAGSRTNAIPAGVPTARRDGRELKMALDRAFALGAVALGVAIVAFVAL